MIEKPQPWPAMAGWLPATTPPLAKAIIFRAFQDLGICEIPPGSNRSGRIDTYAKRGGSPLGSWWCALWATAVLVDAGADVPATSRGSCDVLMTWAKGAGLWKERGPVPGDLVLYGVPGDARHVGIIVRHMPYLLSIEGNAPLGSAPSNNGEAVVLRRVATSGILGFVSPRPRSVP